MNPNQSNIHIINANLGKWLGCDLPPEVVEAARANMREKDAARRLRGLWVKEFGEDLHIHVTTFNGDFSTGPEPGEYVADLARGAAVAALVKGYEMGLGYQATSTSPVTLAPGEQIKALEIR